MASIINPGTTSGLHSDNRPLNVVQCVESLRDAFSKCAYIVESLDIRRRHKVSLWKLFSLRKLPEFEGRTLQGTLASGAKQFQAEWESNMAAWAKVDAQSAAITTKELSTIRREVTEKLIQPLSQALNFKGEGELVVDYALLDTASKEVLSRALGALRSRVNGASQ